MRYILIGITALMFSGCFTSFHPTTREGVRCKQQCASNMQYCGASSYTCDRSHSKCLDSCIDLENIIKK